MNQLAVRWITAVSSIATESSASENRTGAFGGKAGVRPTPMLFAGGGVEFIKTRIAPGQDENIPSIDRFFDETTAPGMSQQPGLIRISGPIPSTASTSTCSSS